MADSHSVHKTADILDVHLLDIAAEIEALLRSLRDVQRCVLGVRGIAGLSDCSDAHSVHDRLIGMLGQCETLRDAVAQAADTAAALGETGLNGADSGD